jgi:gamma-glutamylcyclotransferase (GGCT)/AIG2-like uncharacterized protein YtfP
LSGSDIRRIFVYGTLRRDARGAVQNALMRDWVFEGYGRVPADLYDLGAYPGAVPNPTARVRGEVYRLRDGISPDADTLGALDRHEGDEFERGLIEVALENAETAQAWIYWYRLEPRRPRITSGDYLERAGAVPCSSGPEDDQRRAGDDPHGEQRRE